MSFLERHRGSRPALVQLAALVLVLIVTSLAASLVLAAPTGSINPLAVEGPVASEFAVRSVGQIAVKTTAQMNVAAARREDQVREANGLPPRFALSESTWLTPETSGTWENLDSHYQIWRTRISAPGALSLNLGFTGYHLPKGARLSIYPTDVTGPQDVRGVRTFTALDNQDLGELWTPVILSDDIVVELVLPRSERQNYRLELTAINRGYRYFGEDLAPLGVDKSGACNVDVVCPEGDAWRTEINSVAVISTGGTTFCTGSMLNNTAQDGTPYFLTANHCGINTGTAASLVVYWNFQSVNCGDHAGGVLNQFMTGATFLAASATSDFTLVRMNGAVDPAHDVSFAGWDHSANDPTSATAIHHPNTDEKSISFDYNPSTTTGYGGSASPGDGSHIRIGSWDVGTTEPGSSGSPLFDQNHHVVGQLHGGGAACGNFLSDWYGRFSMSWPQISAYLDPLGTGQASLDTYAPWATGMYVAGAQLNANGNIGGPFTPMTTTYIVANRDVAALGYQISSDVLWATLDKTGGFLAPGASDTVTVSLTGLANFMGNGLHTGNLTFTNTTNGDGNTVQSVSLRIGVPVPVYTYNMSADPGWTTTGLWAYGAPQGLGGTAHGNPDPTAGHTGANVIGFDLAGDYLNNLPVTTMTTTAIDCSALSGTALRFWRWLNVEQPSYDHAAIDVSADGVNFTNIWANSAEVADAAWTQVSYDISAIADGQPQVFVRWTMGTTDGSWQYSGWNIDDVEILALPSGNVTPVGDLPRFELSVGNFPNPFNPLTKVSYVLERSGPATVRVYNVQGQLVRELVSGVQPAGPGHVVWDGNDTDGTRAASGVYFVQVRSGGQRADHKMVLLK